MSKCSATLRGRDQAAAARAPVPTELKEEIAMNSAAEVTIANFAVCFIDLLGQREAMKDQGLLPDQGPDAQRAELIRLVKNSVGKISSVHRHAEAMLGAIGEKREPPEPIDERYRQAWDDLHGQNICTQRWSDGLMVFTRLGGTRLTEQINGLYSQFCLAGAMCLVGLAGRAPMRGGIDIAWGVELYPGELYGPAVANAYQLESEVAEFPRIVVGALAREYLEQILRDPDCSVAVQAAKKYAELCLGMLSQDDRGVLFLDYLAPTFESAVTSRQVELLWSKARNFVEEEIVTHKKNRSEKLAARYSRLAAYFDSHPPPSRRGAQGKQQA
jgi:hypothetical protein